MKTEELKKIAIKNGYKFKCVDERLVLEKIDPVFQITIEISRTCTNIIRIKSYGFQDIADMNVMEGAISYTRTPLEDREEEKRYIVPLLGLITSKGNQQYLTHKDGHFFACCRNQELKQTWEEKDLCNLPDQYRTYAVEVED